MGSERVRLVTYITPETDQKVEALKKLTGLTKAKVAALAIQTGVDAIGLAFNPDWKAYFEAILKRQNEESK